MVAQGSESDGNGHYEHAPLIVRRHQAKRASSSTRRPALSLSRPPLVLALLLVLVLLLVLLLVLVLVLEYSFIKLGAACTNSFVS